MPRRTLLTGGIAALVVVGALYVHAESPAPLPAYVVKLADQESTYHGDAHPASAVVVSTTRGAAANAAGGERVDIPRTPVWLVVLRGHFRDRNASVPVGQPTPKGSAIWFTISRKTHHILDFGIGNHAPNLSSLGSVEHVFVP